MNKIFAIFAILSPTIVHAINPPAELATIGNAAHVCYQATAQHFIASMIETPLQYRDGVSYEMDKIYHRAHAFDADNRCFVDISTNIFIASLSDCGFSEENDFVYLHPVATCTPPAIHYSTKDINDGYDRVGNPINPRKALVKAWLNVGSCGDKDIALINARTGQPTPFHINFKDLATCLSGVLPAKP